VTLRTRPKGALNWITRTMKDAVVAAAEELGRVDFDKWREHLKGDPENGMKQFFKLPDAEHFADEPRLQRRRQGRKVSLAVLDPPRFKGFVLSVAIGAAERLGGER
jgi:hypothetical protein